MSDSPAARPETVPRLGMEGWVGRRLARVKGIDPKRERGVLMEFISDEREQWVAADAVRWIIQEAATQPEPAISPSLDVPPEVDALIREWCHPDDYEAARDWWIAAYRQQPDTGPPTNRVSNDVKLVGQQPDTGEPR